MGLKNRLFFMDKGNLMEDQKVVLITGCSTGIGFETALLLARQGYRVFATMRDLKKARPLKDASTGLPVEVLPLDVDKAPSVKKAVAAVVQKAGRIDVLINNAGWGAFGALEEFSDEEIHAQYETNVFGLLRVTRAVLPIMRAQKSGRIVHIGSLAGKMTFAGIGLYCSSKYAVEAITESLRLEVRPFHIEVAVVEPGTIRTSFKTNRHKAKAFLEKKSAYQAVLERILYFGNNPPKSAPGPDQVAETVLKALQASRMTVRYPVGRDAVWFPLIRWFLPDFLYDRVLQIRYSQFQREGPP
jgi:NAD(P)-dependent dehydrogenase (short-subunit alcohol dehydrogenase family)